MEGTGFVAAAAAAVASAAGFAVSLAMLAKAHARKAASDAEAARATAELESLKRSAGTVEENFRQRLADKDAACARMLSDKESACAKMLADKDAACAKMLAEKDGYLAKRIEDRDEQYARAMREKKEEMDRFLEERGKSFEEAVKTLKEQFTNLAAATLKAQSGDLVKVNAQQLETALKPLRDQVEILKSATERTQAEHAKLAEEIGKDAGSISTAAKELAKVSEALAGNVKIQGRTGEEILAEKLRQAGLEEGVNFVLQDGIDGMRPDAQVWDTENRWLVIDSKVSMAAYFRYADSRDDNERAALLKEHVKGVEEQIKQLASKKYPEKLGEKYKDRNYLPVTAMFVPYEAPLLEALKARPDLWKMAADGNVILVTPLTLLAYLRLVYLAWQREKESRNREEIMKTAKELLSRMNVFLLAFESVGKKIDEMHEAYDNAKKTIVDEPRTHTIAKSANKLLELNVRMDARKGKGKTPTVAACIQLPDETKSAEETCEESAVEV